MTDYKKVHSSNKETSVERSLRRAAKLIGH